MTLKSTRDHGGGLDAAMAKWGGTRADWIDLSTGINPVPYPIPDIPAHAWTALPDSAAQNALIDAARSFWSVPDGAAILAAPGASALIARLPSVLGAPGTVHIPGPTYNEHEAAFRAAGWALDAPPTAQVQVVVNPNNPDGRHWRARDLAAPIRIIDESFCDTTPDATLMDLATSPGTIILKSFGKFWGLAGVRIGFAIGDPSLIAALAETLGPWPVAGPALSIGTAALNDIQWADTERNRLQAESHKLDTIMSAKGAHPIGGTSLFRLYQVDDASAWQDRLGRAHILSRIFPYSKTWLRLGLPAPHHAHRIAAL